MIQQILEHCEDRGPLFVDLQIFFDSNADAAELLNCDKQWAGVEGFSRCSLVHGTAVSIVWQVFDIAYDPRRFPKRRAP